MTATSDYLGNLECPDLRSYFPHLRERPMAHTFGRVEICDWADKPLNDPVFGNPPGFWNREEVSILHAAASQKRGLWLDIGSHTGFTTAHIADPFNRVVAVEPMLWNTEFFIRFRDNTGIYSDLILPWAGRSDQFFATVAGCPEPVFDGIVIDGDHNAPCPLLDAQNAHDRLRPHGVILLHDAIGGPVQEAATWLMDRGYRCRMYMTPHVVACCWRGDWKPPDHIPDPSIDWERVKRDYMAGFDFSRCE